MAAKCSRRNKLLVIGKQIATPEHYAAILCSWSIFMEKPAWHCGNCGLSTWFRSLLSKIFHFPTDYSLDENFETSQHFNIVKKKEISQYYKKFTELMLSKPFLLAAISASNAWCLWSFRWTFVKSLNDSSVAIWSFSWIQASNWEWKAHGSY